MNPLRVAAFAFEATADARHNLQLILQALHKSSEAGARVLVIPECGLCGYPPVTEQSLESLSCAKPGSSFHQNNPSSLCALGDHEDLLHIRAQALGIAVIVGNASFWQNGMSNDLFVCGAVSETVRYRKRCLTPLDRAFFNAGDESVCCQIDDWKIGLSICFDVRFNEIWREFAHQGCDLFINAAHMAGPDDDHIKKEVIPSLYQSRATEWVTPLFLCNTSAADKWLASSAWDARGHLLQQRDAGLLVQDFYKRDNLSDWYQQLYTNALAMKAL